MKKNVLALTVLTSLLYWAAELQGQGVINFNEPWIGTPGVVSNYANYYEAGFWFRVVNSYQRPPLSPITRVSAAPGAHMPFNGTPFIVFGRYAFDDHVVFSSSDGTTFGLVSVDLAHQMAPAPGSISIVFEGYRPGYYNPFVSVTFTTSGGGTSSFETFYFPTDFASGLAWVAIPSTGWAMDNLVWVPEPSTYGLVGLSLLALAWKRFHQRRKLRT